MDTTPEYVRQCAAAEELQGEWRPAQGDWVYHTSRKRIATVNYRPRPTEFSVHLVFLDDSGISESRMDKGNIHWLPRLDQLMEMSCYDEVGLAFQSIAYWRQTDAVRHLMWVWKTREQLVLAYLMETRYGKRWNPETGKWEGK